jgi:hypothetical protein
MVHVHLEESEVYVCSSAVKVWVNGGVAEASRLTAYPAVGGEHWPIGNVNTVRPSSRESVEHGGEVRVVLEYDLVCLWAEWKVGGLNERILVECVSAV